MKIVKGIAVIEGDECISKWVIESGRLDHDQNALPIILKHITKDSVVIDAGAYIGDHTIAYAKAKKVIAFEPNPEAFECLEYNLKDFKNVELHNKGLSDKLGKISLTNVPTNGGMTYAKKSTKGIEVITIDSLNIDVDLIKIDCEGFELNILKGAEETIKRCSPVLVIEINNHALLRNGTSDNDVYIYLMSLGYEIKNIYPNEPLHATQLDVICKRK